MKRIREVEKSRQHFLCEKFEKKNSQKVKVKKFSKIFFERLIKAMSYIFQRFGTDTHKFPSREQYSII